MLERVLSPHDQRPLGGGLVYLFLGTMSSSRNDHVRNAEARRQAAVETHVALAAGLLRLQAVVHEAVEGVRVFERVFTTALTRRVRDHGLLVEGAA